MLKNRKPNLKTLDYHSGKWGTIYCYILTEIVRNCDILKQNNIRLKVYGDSDPYGCCEGWVVIIREEMRRTKKRKKESKDSTQE